MLITFNCNMYTIHIIYSIKAISAACPKLTYLDLAYCYQLTDASLISLGQGPLYTLNTIHKSPLLYLNINGCNNITDHGMLHLSIGSAGTLNILKCNGCDKLTDYSAYCIASICSIHTLSIQSCNRITNKGIKVIILTNKNLKSLDIYNLDEININIIQLLSIYNPYMTYLNCHKCDMIPIQFANIINTHFYYIQAIPATLKTEPKPKNEIKKSKFKEFVYKTNKYATIIQIWYKSILHKRQLYKNKLLYDKQLLQYNIQIIKVENIKYNIAARKIARCIFRSKNRALLLYHKNDNNIRINSIILIQSLYKGYYTRKRTNRIYNKLYYYYTQIAYIAYKYIAMTGTRTLKFKLIKIQAQYKRYYYQKYYNILYKFVRYIQRRYILYFTRKTTAKNLILHSINTVLYTNKYKCILYHNIHAYIHNKTISRSIINLSKVYDRQYNTLYNSTILIQRIYRGYVSRCYVHNIRAYENLRVTSSLTVQRVYRGYVGRKHALYYKNIWYRWYNIVYKHRCAMRLGVYVKPIQRVARLYIWYMRRIHAAKKILLYYRRFQSRRLEGYINNIKG